MWIFLRLEEVGYSVLKVRSMLQNLTCKRRLSCRISEPQGQAVTPRAVSSGSGPTYQGAATIRQCGQTKHECFEPSDRRDELHICCWIHSRPLLPPINEFGFYWSVIFPRATFFLHNAKMAFLVSTSYTKPS